MSALDKLDKAIIFENYVHTRVCLGLGVDLIKPNG